MNRRTLFVTMGWIALNLLSASPLFAVPEHAEEKPAAGADVKLPATGDRPTLDSVPLPAQYDDLLKSLKKVTASGLKITEQVAIDGKIEDKKIDIADVEALKKWVKNFTVYREDMKKCAINRDRSADLMGTYLDNYVAELFKVITADPTKAKGTDAKGLITATQQIIRFLDAKKVEFKSELKDFEKTDDAFKTQIVKTFEVFFGPMKDQKFDEATASAFKTGTAPDEKTPYASLVTDMNLAVKALKDRALNGDKVCKPISAAPPKKVVKEKTAAEIEKEKADKAKKAELDSKVEPPKLDPAPPKGKPGDGPAPTPTPVATPTPTPIVEPPIQPVGPQGGVVDPGQLQNVLDGFRSQLAQQAQDLNNRVNDVLKNGQDALQNLARQQQLQNQDQNRDNLADALKNVGNRGGDRSNTENPQPQPQLPQIAASPSNGGGNQGIPPVPLNDPGQPPPPPPMQFMPPPSNYASTPVVPQQQSAPIEDRRRGYLPIPVVQSSGIMDMLRATQAKLAESQLAQRNAVASNGVSNRQRALNGPRTGMGARTLGARTMGSRISSGALSRRLGTSSLAMRTGPNANLTISPQARTNLPESVASRSNLSQ